MPSQQSTTTKWRGGFTRVNFLVAIFQFSSFLLQSPRFSITQNLHITRMINFQTNNETFWNKYIEWDIFTNLRVGVDLLHIRVCTLFYFVLFYGGLNTLKYGIFHKKKGIRIFFAYIMDSWLYKYNTQKCARIHNIYFNDICDFNSI